MICLIGESGSGKSAIERLLCDAHGLKRVVSFTTRPPRKGEISGVDYHFINDDTFMKMEADGMFAETTKFREWYYGAAVEDIKNKDVFVIEPIGLKKLLERKEELGLSITTVYIKVPERQRMIRMLERDDDVDEVIRRIGNDRITFKDVEELTDHVVHNTSHITLSTDEVLNIYKMSK